MRPLRVRMIVSFELFLVNYVCLRFHAFVKEFALESILPSANILVQSKKFKSLSCSVTYLLLE